MIFHKFYWTGGKRYLHTLSSSKIMKVVSNSCKIKVIKSKKGSKPIAWQKKSFKLAIEGIREFPPPTKHTDWWKTLVLTKKDSWKINPIALWRFWFLDLKKIYTLSFLIDRDDNVKNIPGESKVCAIYYNNWIIETI